VKPQQKELPLTMEEEAPLMAPSAQDAEERSRVLEAALASKLAHHLGALESLIEERCAGLESDMGRRMTVLEVIVQSRSAEFVGQVIDLDKTWAMAGNAVVREMERQLGVRLDSEKDLERRLSEMERKVVELEETRTELASSAADQQSTVARLGEHIERKVAELEVTRAELASSAADQQSTVARLGEHMEMLETSLEAVRSQSDRMSSAAEVLRSDAHGTSETTATNRQYLDVMQAKVEALQLQVDQVGLKVVNFANESQGIHSNLQVLDDCIYMIYGWIRAESQKQQQKGCGNVPEFQEYNELPAPSNATAECLGMTQGVTPSAEAGFASVRRVRFGTAPSSSPSLPVPLESRNPPALVLRDMPSSTVTVASQRAVPEEAGTAPLRTRIGSGSPHRATTGTLGSVRSRAPSPQPVPGTGSPHRATTGTLGSARSRAPSPQPVPGTMLPSMDMAAAGGLVKNSMMTHAGPEGPYVPLWQSCHSLP